MSIFTDLLKKVAPSVAEAIAPEAVQSLPPEVAPVLQSIMGLPQRIDVTPPEALTPEDLEAYYQQNPGQRVELGNRVRDTASRNPASIEPSIWDDTRHAATNGWQSVLKGAGKAGDFLSSPIGLGTAGAATNILGGVLANQAAKKDYAASEGTLRQAAELAGAYNQLPPSALAAIQDNPELLAMRQQALQETQKRATMGLTPEDEAILNKIRNQASSQFQTRKATIEQDMQRRGMANSGFNLASQMMGNVGETQRQSDLADQQAAMSFKAKQDATKSLGDMSSRAISEDFNREEQKASAMDRFNEANVQNQMSAARAKAGYMAPIASSQAKAGERTADIYNKGAQTVSGLLTGIAQQKQQNKK
jgi:hypothetical protein